MTTPGKLHHLLRAATPAGHFVILAIDHRQNLRDGLERNPDGPLTDTAFTAFKREVVEALMPAGASALLIDPEFGLNPGLRDGWIPRDTGLLAPLEETDYKLHPSRRAYRPIPDWSPRAIHQSGADGVKLLIYYHPESPDAARQRGIVARTVEECATLDLPLYLEPIAFSPDPTRALPTAELTDIAIENARLFSGMGIDVLECEFPVDISAQPDEALWKSALARLNDVCLVPWTLLSAGVPWTIFRRQAALACAAGASGVIVGRAVWAEAVSRPAAQRKAFLAGEARDRLAELAQTCATSARDFRTHGSPAVETGADGEDTE